MKGNVLKYDVRRGFGFVMGDDGQRYFVHKSMLPFWVIYLVTGDRIEFIPQKSDRKRKGPMATDIRVVNEAKK